MADEIFFDGRRFISAGEAATASDLTRDYVARLARDGKVRGRRIGKNWYIDQESISSFLLGQRFAKSSRSETLVAERLREYRGETPARYALSKPSAPSHVASRAGAKVPSGGDAPLIRTHASDIKRKFAQALQSRDTLAAHTIQAASAPAGFAHAAFTTVHAPTHAISPLVEFFHKLIALTLAVMLTFGTYAAADPAFARFAANSISEETDALLATYRALTNGGIGTMTSRAESQLAAAAENPAGTFSTLRSSLADGAAGLARGVHESVDSFVYGIAFPRELIRSLGTADRSRASVAVKIRTARDAAATSNQSSAGGARTATANSITDPIIERVYAGDVERAVQTERILAVGGISEELLNARLQELDNKFTSLLVGFTASAPSFSGSAYSTPVMTQVIAQSSRIDHLGNVDIDDNSTWTGGTISSASISGSSVSATSLAVSGSASLATSTVGGSLTVTSGTSSTNPLVIKDNVGTDIFVVANDGTVTQNVSSSTSSFSEILITGNATATTLYASNLIVSQTASTTNMLASSASSTNLFATSTVFVNATSTNFFATNASSSNASSTNLFAVNASTTNASTTNLFAITASTTNATSTTLYSTLAHFVTGVIDTLTATAATITDLIATTLTVTNLTATSATTTAATSTHLAVFNRIFAPVFTATSTTAASVFPYASSTALTVSGSASTTDLTISGAANLSNIAADALLYNDTSRQLAAASVGGSLIFSAGTLSLNTSNANTWTALQQFNGKASTTQFSAYNGAYFGATATSSFSSAGALTLATPLLQASGGTGFGSYTAGDILYADNVGALAKLGIGSAGQVLKVQAGLPAWGTDNTGAGGGSGFNMWATTSLNLIYPIDTSYPVAIGTNATATPNSIFEVSGQQYISSKLGIATTSPVTALSVGGNAYLTGGLGVGLFNSTAGTLQTSGDATIGGALTIAGNTNFPGSGIWNSSGTVGIGTTSPWALLSVHPNGIGGPSFAVGSSTQTDFIVTNGGRVGVATSSPSSNFTFSVTGTGYFSGNTTIGGTFAVSGLTSGRVPYVTAGGALTDSSALAFDGTKLLATYASSTALTASASAYFATAGGSVGVASTSPWAKLSVHANDGDTVTTLFAVGSSTASATSTLFSVSNIGSTTLFRIPSTVLTTDADGTIIGTTSVAAAYGGTGQTSVTTGDLLYGSASNVWSKLGIGSGGTVLSVSNGLPAWVATTTFSGGLTYSAGNVVLNTGNANTFTALQQFNANASTTQLSALDAVYIGRTATTTIRGDGVASTIPYASSTALTVSGTGYFDTASTTNLTVSGLSSVLLSTNSSGAAQAAAIGSSLLFSANTLSLNTGNANTFTALQQFNANASTTMFSAYNGAYFGATATSSFSSTGTLTLASALGLGSGGTATSTFYSGGVVFSDGTKLTQSAAAANFFWDNTNKRLGIGTSTPWAQLSINPNDIGIGPSFAVGSSTQTHFIVDNAGQSGFSTTTPWGRLSVDTSNLASLIPSFVIGSSTRTDLIVTQAGFTGIGTTSPYSKLSVANTVSGPQLSLAYDTLRYGDLRIDSTGDFHLGAQGQDFFLNDDNLWVCTGGSCPAGNPSGTGNLVVENRAGFGTSTPAWNLEVAGTRPSLAISDTGAGGTDLKHWLFSSMGGTLYIGTSTDAYATTSIAALTLTNTGYLGVGTTTPIQSLSTRGLVYVGANGATGLGTATSTFQGDIKIVGKLDVSTIDPVYTIDGVKYATYGASTIGIREEALSTIHLDTRNADGRYVYTIPFSEMQEGSDMWLFYQITDFGEDWENLVVSLTPSFNGNVFYKKDVATNTLVVYADQPGEVSMRLSAYRYDFTKWGNLRTDQEDDSYLGHVIRSKP